VEGFLDRLRTALRDRSFCPVPVRERMIPKAGGKQRRLGIATVTDRVVQASLTLVLEPILEADFLPCSYGFRPGRRAHDAIAEARYLATRSYEWIVEGDITACFDEIAHPALMDRLRKRKARPGPGQGVPEGRHPRPGRGAAGQHHRGAAGWDSFPRAGQLGLIGVGRAHRPDPRWAGQQPKPAGPPPPQGPGELPSRPVRRRLCATNADGGCDVEDREFWMRCCVGDGGRPSGTALQGEVPNHRKLLRL